MEKQRIRLDKEVVLFHINNSLGCDLNLLRIKSRKREFVDNRRIAGYFLYKYTDGTYDEIADTLNVQNHTNVIHYVNSMENLIGTNPFITAAHREIESKLLYELRPVEKLKRDLFVSSIMRLIVPYEMGTTRDNLNKYYYDNLLKEIDNERL